jgi:hypothetical protein
MRASLVFVLALALHAPGAAESFDDRLRFGDFLMLEKRYHDAELEYERLAFSTTDAALRQKALQKAFDAALVSGEPSFLLTVARTWESREPQNCLPSFYVERALYELNNHDGVVRQALPPGCSSELKAADDVLKGLSHYWQRDWAQGVDAFQRVPAESPLALRAQAAMAAAPKGESLKLKSPGLAAGLSAMVPGAGYAYANRPQTAAAALVVTGLFIAGTYGAAREGEPGLAALLGLFSFGWYFGGVSGSARAADRENHSRLSHFIAPFELNAGTQ